MLALKVAGLTFLACLLILTTGYTISMWRWDRLVGPKMIHPEIDE